MLHMLHYIVALFSLLYISIDGQTNPDSSDVFSSIPKYRLPDSAVRDSQIYVGIDKCREQCFNVKPWCRSFTHIKRWYAYTCQLSEITLSELGTNPSFKLVFDSDSTTYISNFRNMFHLIANHILVLTDMSSRPKITDSAEECAKLCYTQGIRCKAFIYDRIDANKPSCTFTTESVSGSSGVLPKQGIDIYEKLSAGSYLVNFFSYGAAELTDHVYKQFNDTQLEDCSQLCYLDSEMCKSMDFDQRRKICKLNSATASDFPQNVVFISDENEKKIHYERHDGYTRQFFVKLFGTSNTTVLKAIVNTSASKCAETCIGFQPQICRSFSFLLKSRTCLLYDTANNDINSLTPTPISNMSLHFDMISYQECSGSYDDRPQILTENKGSVASPMWPYYYPPFSQCYWQILPMPGKFIYVKFTYFYLNDNENKCDKTVDHFILNETLYCKRNTLTQFQNFTFAGNKLDVKFKSFQTQSQIFHGFRLFFTTDNGYGTLDKPMQLDRAPGEIFSPGYPESSKKNASWTIQEKNQGYIKCTFIKFSVGRNINNCYSTHYILIDGKPTCGNLSELETIWQNTKPIKIDLIINSNETAADALFVMQYTFSETTLIPSNCQKIINLDTNTIVNITSPGFESRKKLSTGQCDYILSHSFGKVSVKFFSFDVGVRSFWTGTCNEGRLIVDDVTQGIYCGKNRPDSLILSASKTKLRLIISEAGKYSGFSAQVSLYKEPTLVPPTVVPINCLQEINNVSSPNFPKVYPANANCNWLFLANNQQQVKITFTNFTLTQFVYRDIKICTNDEVILWDSAGSSSDINQELGRLCGLQITPLSFFSTQNSLYVQFNSASNSPGALGFRASIDYVNAFTCSGNSVIVVTEDDSYLLSPNFPNNPRGLYNCTWNVQYPLDKSVRLYFDQFIMNRNENVFSENSCNNYENNLVITQPNGIKHGPYCGTNFPNVNIVPSNSLINFNIYEAADVRLLIRVAITEFVETTKSMTTSPETTSAIATMQSSITTTISTTVLETAATRTILTYTPSTTTTTNATFTRPTTNVLSTTPTPTTTSIAAPTTTVTTATFTPTTTTILTSTPPTTTTTTATSTLTITTITTTTTTAATTATTTATTSVLTSTPTPTTTILTDLPTSTTTLQSFTSPTTTEILQSSIKTTNSQFDQTSSKFEILTTEFSVKPSVQAISGVIAKDGAIGATIFLLVLLISVAVFLYRKKLVKRAKTIKLLNTDLSYKTLSDKEMNADENEMQSFSNKNYVQYEQRSFNLQTSTSNYSPNSTQEGSINTIFNSSQFSAKAPKLIFGDEIDGLSEV